MSEWTIQTYPSTQLLLHLLSMKQLNFKPELETLRAQDLAYHVGIL